ncbi:MAG: glycosyltransferase [Candidatus Krumholzibacteriota bacterium]|nr:glycosyltransferase [Candidatus Krumholzibacteriota bacterium]
MESFSENQKSILFITYHFPPDSEIGGKRTARLAKFFREKGWNVGVLTVKERYYEIRDDSFTVDDIVVYRTYMFKNVRFLYLNIKKWFKKKLKNQSYTNRDIHYREVDGKNDIGAEKTFSLRLFSRLKRYILSLVWLPDDHQGWVPFALFKCLSIIDRYDIVYSSSPPKSVPLIPLFATYFPMKFIWVSEFRDPWDVSQKPKQFRSKFTNYLENKWEYEFFKRSSMVIAVTEAMEKNFSEKFPYYSEKIKTFYNGFDEDEFKHIDSGDKREDDGKLVLTYAGHFSYGRNPRSLMEALSELIRENALQRNKVEIRLIGDLYVEGESIKNMADEFHLSDVVKCMGYVAFNECLKQMSKSDIFLLFNIEQPLQVPAKFFEYIALGKSILSISTGGITDRLIERTGTGISVKPEDIPGIKDAIMKLASMTTKVVKEEVRKFDIKVIFEELENELSSIIEM